MESFRGSLIILATILSSTLSLSCSARGSLSLDFCDEKFEGRLIINRAKTHCELSCLSSCPCLRTQPPSRAQSTHPDALLAAKPHSTTRLQTHESEAFHESLYDAAAAPTWHSQPALDLDCCALRMDVLGVTKLPLVHLSTWNSSRWVLGPTGK